VAWWLGSRVAGWLVGWVAGRLGGWLGGWVAGPLPEGASSGGDTGKGGNKGSGTGKGGSKGKGKVEDPALPFTDRIVQLLAGAVDHQQTTLSTARHQPLPAHSGVPLVDPSGVPLLSDTIVCADGGDSGGVGGGGGGCQLLVLGSIVVWVGVKGSVL
jgi:hypothetical protein